MDDIVTIIEKVKRKRNSASVKRTFVCDNCKRTIIKILPPLYSPPTMKCSCGCNLNMI